MYLVSKRSRSNVVNTTTQTKKEKEKEREEKNNNNIAGFLLCLISQELSSEPRKKWDRFSEIGSV